MAIAVVSFILWRREHALVGTVRQEVAGLRTELESRDKVVSELQSKVEESSQPPPSQKPPLSAGSFAELERRLDQLTAQQNKTLALVQSLASGGAQAESPESKQQRRQSAIALLDGELKTQQERLDAAKEKVEQLVTTWNVPDEVSRMDVSAGLDSVALKQYGPYFEARRERDELQRFVSILKMKVAAEKIDLSIDTTKDGRR
jgi:hypothetical protein